MTMEINVPATPDCFVIHKDFDPEHLSLIPREMKIFERMASFKEKVYPELIYLAGVFHDKKLFKAVKRLNEAISGFTLVASFLRSGHFLFTVDEYTERENKIVTEAGKTLSLMLAQRGPCETWDTEDQRLLLKHISTLGDLLVDFFANIDYAKLYKNLPLGKMNGDKNGKF